MTDISIDLIICKADGDRAYMRFFPFNFIAKINHKILEIVTRVC